MVFIVNLANNDLRVREHMYLESLQLVCQGQFSYQCLILNLIVGRKEGKRSA